MRALTSKAFTALMAASLLISVAAPVSGANPPGHTRSKAPAKVDRVTVPSGRIEKMSGSLLRANGRIAVFVQLANQGAADAFSTKLPSGKNAAIKAANAAKAASGRTATAVVRALKTNDKKARELFRTRNAVSGVAVLADAAQIRKLAARADVKSILVLTPKKVENAHSAELINVLSTWQDLGVLGDGVRVGVIDTGIDYTHANFGGAGTPAAFDAIDPTNAAGVFPTAKVVGGTDLAGENYDAASDNPAELVPVPDNNPLDCDGHGSHVSGTVAGFGENANRSTFTGNYSGLTESALNDMRIGPGMAPHALLYGVKVFGCPAGGAGSTLLVAPAIDWALDPDQNGDFSDHLDLVNISIGGDYGAPDDPESLFVRNALQHGMLSVISAGNAGDLYDVGGSPGNTPEALTVASSRDNYELLDAAEVLNPNLGLKPGQYSVLFDYAGFTRTATVAGLSLATNLDGCNPFDAADAARVAGKFAWLEWDDNDATRRCGSIGRTNNAEAAGAVGVILTSTLDHFSAGINGNANIPVFQLTHTATEALRPSLAGGSLTMRLAGDLRGAFDFIDPAIQDTPSGFTSRDTRTPGVKPDIAAPGDTIVSTAMGTGNDRAVLSGTSMASPHVAGVAALLHGAHPTWTPAELKAALMNTSVHDIFSKDGPAGPIDAPNRVGAGRIDARAALGNLVIAAVDDTHATVSVGFGVVEVGPSHVTMSKTIKLTNKSGTAASFDASYDPITTIPGVSYTLSAATVTVPAHGTANVTVNLDIDRAAMRKTIDPTVAKEQSFFGLFDLPRQFLADASGRVVFEPTAGSDWTLRVPVYSAPKPTSANTFPSTVTVPGKDGTTFLQVGGRSLAQGTGDQRYLGLYSVLELGASSPQLPDCTASLVSRCAINGTAKGGDLRYVGAGSTAPQAKAAGRPHDSMIYFGIATWSNWYNIGANMIPFVDIDVDGDGAADFETFVWRQTDTDLLWARTDDLHTGDNVDLEPINTQFGDVDTNTFDTNVIVMPVFLDALGIDVTKASARLSYQTGVAGFYTAPADSLIDFTGEVSYDPLAPGLWAEGAVDSAIYVATAGTGLDIHRNDKSLKKDNQKSRKNDIGSLLVLDLHNGSGSRAVVTKVEVGKK